MSSHDSFSVSGSSPTKKKTKWDFRVEFHGAIVLWYRFDQVWLRWVENTSARTMDTNRIDPRLFWSRATSTQILGGIGRIGLVAR